MMGEQSIVRCFLEQSALHACCLHFPASGRTFSKLECKIFGDDSSVLLRSWSSALLSLKPRSSSIILVLEGKQLYWGCRTFLPLLSCIGYCSRRQFSLLCIARTRLNWCSSNIREKISEHFLLLVMKCPPSCGSMASPL